MLTLKCKNCGGEMSVDSSGLLFCDYCGNKYAFNDSELTGYRNFRLEMLNYLRGVHDEKSSGENREDILWNNAETVVLKNADGKDITIKYLYSYSDDICTSYLAKETAIYVFDKKHVNIAADWLENINKLSYPPADVKGLEDCFPKFLGKYELSDKGMMLAFERSKNLFPLSMFGSLAPEHVAWIISRLENICCVFNYSDIVHGNINENNVWINPFNHHAVLMGGWNDVRALDNNNKDLCDIRKTGLKVLGIHKDESNQPFIDFLNSAPSVDAYTDFEKWDRVIEVGFGGRRFAKMETTF